MTTQRVVIIGGGIGGLSAAGLLARDGYDVTVLEALPSTGGRAGSWEKDGFRFDTGPSWYLMPEVFDHWYRLMGTSANEQLDLQVLDPGYRVFFEPNGDGPAEHVDIEVGRERNLDVFERMEPGSREAMARYLDSATETYEIAKKYFLYTSFVKLGPILAREVVVRLATLARLLTTPIWSFAGRFVKTLRAKQVLGYPAVFLGASPYSAPSMFHLMSHLDLVDGVLYAQGGFHRVLESIREVSEAAGATIRTGARVTRIAVDESGKATGVVYDDASGQHQLTVDIVISGADLHHTETVLLPRERQSFPEEWWAKKQPSPGAVLVYLGVKGELPNLLHHSLFFTENWEDNFGRIFADKPSVPDPASFYVCTPSTTDASVAPAGDSNVFVLVPCPADVSLGKGGLDGNGDATIEKIADRTIDAIARWADIPDFRERIVVRRTVGPADFANDLNAWRGNSLGPAHTLMQSALFRATNKSKKVDGLYYVGSGTIPGIGLPMCLISAEVLLKRLRGDHSAGPLPDQAI
ncbi:MAG: phytoene desaturase family protein [Microbacteriaceae bacterium]